MYLKAPTLRYGIWGTPRVIRNEKRQNMLTRASADSTPILTDQQPSSGSFWTTHGRARVPACRKYIQIEHLQARITSQASSSRYEAKNAVEMYSPGTLSRGTEAAASFILSIQRASPILKKRIGLALGEWTGAPSHFSRPHAPLSPFAPGFRCPVSRLPAKTY